MSRLRIKLLGLICLMSTSELWAEQRISASSGEDDLGPLMAAGKKKKKKKKSKKDKEDDALANEQPLDAAPADASAAPVKFKKFFAGIEGGYVGALAVGARLGYSFSPMIGLDLPAVYLPPISTYGISGFLGSLRLKLSFGPGIYVAGGMGLRQYSSKTIYEFEDPNADPGYSIYSTLDLGPEGAVGMAYSFGKFMIGADAVSLYFPVARMSKVEDPEPNLLEDQKEDEIIKGSKKAKALMLGFARVYIAIQF